MKKKITALLAGIFALVINSQAQVPSVTITNTTPTICAGACAIYQNTATNAPTTWTWYFPGAVTTQTVVTGPPGNPPCVTYANPGTYPVICVVRNGFGSDSVTLNPAVKVFALPTATINPPYGGICDTGGGSAFDTVYFSATGAVGNTYTWQPLNGSLSCTACPNPKATPTVTTVYTITVTGAGGCQNTYYDTVTVGSIVAHITGKDSICMGYLDTLVASGGSQSAPGTTYAWSNGKTTSSIAVSPSVPTTYSVTIFSGTGNCRSTAAYEVFPFPVPHFTLTSPDSICYPGSATITASPGGGVYQYYWFGPYGGQDTINYWTVTPNVSTTYTLIVRNKGCYFDSLIKIKVNDPPIVRLTGATNLCQGSTTTITATGGTQYHWSTGASTSSVNVRPPASITYTVQVANGACFKDTTFTIIVDTMPNVKFKGDTSICVGDSTTIYVSGGLTYSWTNGSTTDSVHVIHGYPIGGLYPYYVTVTKGACSKDSAKIVVKVYPRPKPYFFPADTTVCEYDSVSLSVTGGNYYIWSPKNSGLNHYKSYADTDRNNAAPKTTTKYDVKVCTWGCCRDTNIMTLNIIPGPSGKVYSDTTVASGTPVQLEVVFDPGPFRVLSWSPTTGLSCSTCPNPIATVDYTTKYVVTLQDYSTSCTVKDSVTIDIFNCNIFVPNIFSPNGDGYNDYLYVRSLCLKNMDFAVFDRFGNKVFETRNQGTPWDGTYHGKAMDMGTYMWYLNAVLEDGTNIVKSGNVTLLR